MRPTSENAPKVWKAIQQFGAPHRKLKLEDFYTPNTVFQVGVEPNRIDLLTSVSGVEFDAAWPNRRETTVDGLKFFVIGRNELIQNKRASGRPKDLADVAWLEVSAQ